ncbi:MAG: hypothetical protein OXG81_08005 [Acidobacteria bacterium]|nr:hypothetical protein [Acidobacteriota bacterium]
MRSQRVFQEQAGVESLPCDCAVSAWSHRRYPPKVVLTRTSRLRRWSRVTGL